jgi:hypothetical protein
VAACNAKQKSVALGYYQSASKPVQVAIQRACARAGMPLVPTNRPIRRDPCEVDPLQCQK